MPEQPPMSLSQPDPDIASVLCFRYMHGLASRHTCSGQMPREYSSCMLHSTRPPAPAVVLLLDINREFERVTAKSYKRIILHAGLHKTGTTSIQDNCYKFRHRLLEHGIVYPSFTLGNETYVIHSYPITAALTGRVGIHGMGVRLKNIRDPHRARKVFADQMQHLMDAPDADTLLLSGEQVCDFDSSSMKAVRSYFEKYTEQLEVIAYVRSPTHSLGSIMQQRCRDGLPSDPAEFYKIVKERYQRLQRAFPGQLRVVNFHQAVENPLGLVGHFLCDIGMPREKVAALEFTSSNERVSMEAYNLMNAINQTFPRDGKKEHGLQRGYHDLHSLNSLPGQRFQLTNELDLEISQSLEEQRQWLEQELQTSFPEEQPTQIKPLWQQETLMALEAAINSLDSLQMRQVARSLLQEEAERLQDGDPETSCILKFIAQKICVSDEPSTDLILSKLGADYFKFSALQVERGSLEMSLLLMQLAQKLRQDAPFITERIQYYQEKLKEP